MLPKTPAPEFAISLAVPVPETVGADMLVVGTGVVVVVVGG